MHLSPSSRFKTKSTVSQLESVALVGFPDVEASVASAKAFASGVQLTKKLVNAPPNVCTPTYLAMTAAGKKMLSLYRCTKPGILYSRSNLSFHHATLE